MAIDPKSDAALEVSDQAEYNRLLREAPIEELAGYLGSTLDEAVKMRVAAAVEAAPPKMEISVRPQVPQNNFFGYASVKIGGVTVDDFKIMQNKESGELFAAPPSKQDRKNPAVYHNTVHIDKDFRADFNKAVIEAYNAAVEQAQARAASMRPAPDRPPERMTDQVAKAAKEAEAHNAALPPQGKGAKTRGGRE